MVKKLHVKPEHDVFQYYSHIKPKILLKTVFPYGRFLMLSKFLYNLNVKYHIIFSTQVSSLYICYINTVSVNEKDTFF